MEHLKKIQKRLVGKHLYHVRKNDGERVGIGEYIGKVTTVTNVLSILVKNNISADPLVYSINELNEQHLKGEICILRKSIKR